MGFFEPKCRYSDVVIIGAGISGVNMACQLQRKLGITDYTIYDRAQLIGGAWAANQYPGCGVDIPGALYSLSWCPNPSFEKIFPTQKEILSYVQRVASSNRILDHVVTQTEWLGAVWDENKLLWSVFFRDLQTGDQFTHTSKVLISAVGGYTNPKLPTIPGLDRFKGRVVHTAQWNQAYDLRGLDVAIIGNGCSATQVVPAIVDEVKSLKQFIRQPQHYVPMPLGNMHIPWPLRITFWLFPFVLMFLRWAIFCMLDNSLVQFYKDDKGSQMRQQSLLRSRRHIQDNAPARYWHLLEPRYSLGCRRRILDCSYIKSLHRPNFCLMKDSIAEAFEDGIITTSGIHHHIDFLILATGFEFSQWRGDSVIGRNGVTLKDHWDKVGGTAAYNSVAIHNFPNLFYILGPNSGSGHTSVVFAAECATDMIIRLIKPVLSRRVSVVEVDESAEARWSETVQSALRQTVLADTCANQYADPKTGWNFFSYPFSSFKFWFSTRFVTKTDWRFL